MGPLGCRDSESGVARQLRLCKGSALYGWPLAAPREVIPSEDSSPDNGTRSIQDPDENLFSVSARSRSLFPACHSPRSLLLLI